MNCGAAAPNGMPPNGRAPNGRLPPVTGVNVPGVIPWDGTNFTDLVASRGYEFNPAANNTVTIDFTAVTTRYVRLRITANTGWPAGQLSALEVYATGGRDAPTIRDKAALIGEISRGSVPAFVALFHRTTRRVELTAAGEAFRGGP